MEKNIVSYSKWTPVITPEEIFADMVGLGSIEIVENKIYWAELRPAEKGRIALVCRDDSGKTADVLPPEFNIRTRLYEYGGLDYAITKDFVFFANFKDQRLYRKNLTDSKPPVAMTPEKNLDGSTGKYGAPITSPDGSFLVFVYEKEWPDKENENFVAMLDTMSTESREPTILAQGCDFYFDPLISPSGTKIAWIQYNHPNMPWNGTELVQANFESGRIVPGSEEVIIGGASISICAIQFDKDDRLHFVMDEANQSENSTKNWYNIYRHDGEKVEPVTQELAEFTDPAWVVGICNYAFLPDGKIIANYSKEGRDYLALIDPDKKEVQTLDSPFAGHANIKVLSEDTVVLIALDTRAPTAVVKLDLNSMEVEVIKASFSTKIPEEDISSPKLVKYPTADGQEAYAQLYLPKNSNYGAPKHEKPPLIVMVHGGPTARKVNGV
ncbi:MAG: hypothetical protein ACXAB4_09180 [Candidatus Hodarchaeales archaeon]|jgi:dipeptidyl aminopeptidase/acylaminoacyl peptidase